MFESGPLTCLSAWMAIYVGTNTRIIYTRANVIYNFNAYNDRIWSVSV